MSKIISNEQVNRDFFLLRAEWDKPVKPGQFCMLRAGDEYPLLSRPISIFDMEEGAISFLYKKIGKGTSIISNMKPGDDIGLRGPYGNGFPVDVSGRIALVGGGVGIAPLYLLAKTLKASGASVNSFLGFSGEPALLDEYKAV